MKNRYTFSLLLATLTLSFSFAVSSPRADILPLLQSGVNAAVAKKPLIQEDGIWWGLHNGGRPTFYFVHLMKHYPPTFTLVMEGCEEVEVQNDGHRFESSRLIAKQSDVSGRGMAVTTQAGVCQSSRKAYILYDESEMPVKNPPTLIP